MSLQEKDRVEGVVDIVFLVDVTGSMEPCIDGMFRNISVFIDTLSVDDEESAAVKDWRAKVVGYRDFLDDEDTAFDDNPFVRDAEAVKAQLGDLQADVGGDEPESLLDALFLVAGMKESESGKEEADRWRHRHEAARVIIVFTDASYHPIMECPEGRGGGVDDVKHLLLNQRIILCMFAPDMECYEELAELNHSEYTAVSYDASDPAGASHALGQFVKDTENFKNTLRALAKSVSRSAATPAL